MNKIQHINLGGVPFSIDEEAYEHLNRYLESIHRHFRDSEGYEEITADIEARMAELFQESLSGRPIITVKEVRDAIVIMGTPEDFGAESIDEEPVGEGKKSGYRPGRRLFRNPEDEVLGGVCSGIAAYLGIQDPLWIRLAFILFTISGGFGIPAYLILWAILPKADTASDRLSMRGEPINASNIGKIIEEEITHFSNKVSELGNELGGKKKISEGQSELGKAIRKGISLLGSAIRVVIELVVSIWKPLLILIGAVLIFAFAAAWIGIVGGLYFTWPMLSFFSPAGTFLPALGAFNVLILIGMVFLALVLFITRLLYGTRLSAPWRAGLTGFWILNLISLFFVGSVLARQFVQEGEVMEETSLVGMESDTLRLKLDKGFTGESWLQIDDELILLDNEMLSRHIRVALEKIEDTEFTLAKKLSARGSSFREAEELAGAISFEPRLSDNVLTVPSEFSIPASSKWRAQEVWLTIGIPEGKSVFIEERISEYVHEMDKADYGQFLWRNPDKVWTMTEDGLYCQSCEEENDE